MAIALRSRRNRTAIRRRRKRSEQEEKGVELQVIPAKRDRKRLANHFSGLDRHQVQKKLIADWRIEQDALSKDQKVSFPDWAAARISLLAQTLNSQTDNLLEISGLRTQTGKVAELMRADEQAIKNSPFRELNNAELALIGKIVSEEQAIQKSRREQLMLESLQLQYERYRINKQHQTLGYRFAGFVNSLFSSLMKEKANTYRAAQMLDDKWRTQALKDIDTSLNKLREQGKEISKEITFYQKEIKGLHKDILKLEKEGRKLLSKVKSTHAKWKREERKFFNNQKAIKASHNKIHSLMEQLRKAKDPAKQVKIKEKLRKQVDKQKHLLWRKYQGHDLNFSITKINRLTKTPVLSLSEKRAIARGDHIKLTRSEVVGKNGKLSYQYYLHFRGPNNKYMKRQLGPTALEDLKDSRVDLEKLDTGKNLYSKNPALAARMNTVLVDFIHKCGGQPAPSLLNAERVARHDNHAARLQYQRNRNNVNALKEKQRLLKMEVQQLRNQLEELQKLERELLQQKQAIKNKRSVSEESQKKLEVINRNLEIINNNKTLLLQKRLEVEKTQQKTEIALNNQLSQLGGTYANLANYDAKHHQQEIRRLEDSIQRDRDGFRRDGKGGIDKDTMQNIFSPKGGKGEKDKINDIAEDAETYNKALSQMDEQPRLQIKNILTPEQEEALEVVPGYGEESANDKHYSGTIAEADPAVTRHTNDTPEQACLRAEEAERRRLEEEQSQENYNWPTPRPGANRG